MERRQNFPWTCCHLLQKEGREKERKINIDKRESGAEQKYKLKSSDYGVIGSNRISGNIDNELNLVVWRLRLEPPNQLPPIF